MTKVRTVLLSGWMCLLLHACSGDEGDPSITDGQSGSTADGGLGGGSNGGGDAAPVGNGNNDLGDAASGGDGDGDTGNPGPGGGGGDGDGDDNGDGDGDTVDPSTLPKFSFFVTSLRAMRELSGSQDGFGGDLRFGETGEDAGLRGADKICATIAEKSMKGASAKQWRAFLSTTKVHAKDRIGQGPWYDRNGRLIAQNLTDLLQTRPKGADPTIRDDLPNEVGEPNKSGSAEGSNDDNHDILTATNARGEYDGGETCGDWTSTQATSTGGNSGGGGFPWGGGGPGGFGGGGPRVGHSWPAPSGNSWMAAHKAHGCAPGVNLDPSTGPGDPRNDSVGAGGGYGGIYCFALTP